MRAIRIRATTSGRSCCRESCTAEAGPVRTPSTGRPRLRSGSKTEKRRIASSLARSRTARSLEAARSVRTHRRPSTRAPGARTTKRTSCARTDGGTANDGDSALVIRDSNGRFATPSQGTFDRDRRALRVCTVGACLAVGAYLVHASAAPHEATSPAQASAHASPQARASTPAHGPTAAAFDAANSAWQRGDYIAALTSYLQVLNAPAGDAFLERIALTTGELYRTSELTSDGRAGRFSPGGRYIVYETGLETSRRTTILRNDRRRAVVADLPGVSATFTPDDMKVAYRRINETEDVKNASRAIESATLTDPRRNALVQTLAWLVARDSTIVVRDSATGHEIELPTPPTGARCSSWERERGTRREQISTQSAKRQMDPRWPWTQAV